MHSPAHSPSLSLIPFFIADAVLLAVATGIACLAPAPLGGAALLGMAGCVGLGAVIALVPFVLNDGRAREAALAERQKQLAALSQATTTASEKLTQAVAMLRDAAESSARTQALAERVPPALLTRFDGLTQALAQAAQTERAREARWEQYDTAQAQAAKQADVMAAMLSDHRVELNRLADVVRGQRAEWTAAFAEVPAVVARFDAARGALERRLAGLDTELDVHFTALAAKIDGQLATAAQALAPQLAAFEAMADKIGHTLAQRAVLVEESQISETAAAVEPMVPLSAPEPVAEQAATVAIGAVTMMSEPSAPVEPPAPVKPVMDPFFIPANGYAALAEAMDSTAA
jgi:septal ring factor EnvC (AmiA/AmiB activator)